MQQSKPTCLLPDLLGLHLHSSERAARGVHREPRPQGTCQVDLQTCAETLVYRCTVRGAVIHWACVRLLIHQCAALGDPVTLLSGGEKKEVDVFEGPAQP